jgi:hypothetical protein
MKHYDEMTQSVLARAETERAAQKQRNRKILVSVVICVCCLACVVLIGTRRNAPDPQDRMLSDATMPTVTEPSATDTAATSGETHEVILLSMAEDGAETVMFKDVAMPYYMQLWIRDVRGLSKPEYRAVKHADEKAANAQIVEPFEFASIYQRSGPSFLITRLVIGFLKVTVDDFQKVEDVVITNNTDIGVVDVSRHSKFDPETGTFPGRLGLTWRPSEIFYHALAEKPDIKYADIQDTITIQIIYTDGAVATAVVDLSFDDEGRAYITQRGITVN